MLIQFLSVAEVVKIHKKMIYTYGGSVGIRDKGLLESAVFQAQVAFGGSYVHQDFYHMAAAYLYHIIKNHPFIDGNKRTGMVTALLFLKENGCEINLSLREFFTLAIDVAKSKKDKSGIACFFKKRVFEN
ncbi:MAG: type II toxin-antitoxin system death-on-curing family toxin [bacterium]